jgi:transcriptional regulator with XRE-family HTH domain
MQRDWVISDRYRAMIGALVDARVRAGVGQRELARRLGRQPSWLNKIERVERRLDVGEFVVIAEALGFDPGDLLSDLLARK